MIKTATNLCPRCSGERWVCEVHTFTAWDNAHSKECSAPGEPCPVCNPCTRDIAPRMPKGFKDIDSD